MLTSCAALRLTRVGQGGLSNINFDFDLLGFVFVLFYVFGFGNEKGFYGAHFANTQANAQVGNVRSCLWDDCIDVTTLLHGFDDVGHGDTQVCAFNVEWSSAKQISNQCIHPSCWHHTKTVSGLFLQMNITGGGRQSSCPHMTIAIEHRKLAVVVLR